MVEKKKCPVCRALGIVPIVYGLSSLDTFERAKRGEVLLGGVVWGNNFSVGLSSL